MKEKIQATLIHLEKEKFPCSAETGSAGRHDPRQRPHRGPRGGRPAAGPLAELPCLALPPVSTRARAPHRQAQRRLPGQRHRGWGEGGAAGTSCPMEMGFGEATEQEGGLQCPSPAFPASGADSSLLAASVVGWRGARPTRGNPGSPPSPPGSRCLSRGARCSAALLAFPGGACTNLELFRGSESPTPPSPRRPRPAPGRPRSRCSRASARALSPSRRVSLGELSAAPGWAAGGETRAPRQGPGHRAPAQPAAGEAAAGAYRAKRRGGAGRRAGSPWTNVGGAGGEEKSRSKKEEEVGRSGGATVARSSRRRLLGDRAGCSAVNDSRETHTLALARPPPPSGIERPPGRRQRAPSRARSLRSPPLPDSPWSRGLGARGPRLARHGDPPTSARTPPPWSTCPFRIPSLGARAAP